MSLLKFIPLFRTDQESLARISVRLEKSDVKSSMLFVLLIEYSLAFGDIELYDVIVAEIKKHKEIDELNFQLWFPSQSSLDSYCIRNVVKDSGFTLQGINFTNRYREYRKQIIKQVNQAINLHPEVKDFVNPYILCLSSRHHRNLPDPILWRRRLVTFNEKGLAE